MNFNEARDYLYALKTQRTTYGFERMACMAEALGHPQHHYPCIHVAGTNGKGSVCAMLEAIYRAAGYCTGLYTSPHLVYLGERVQINRKPITPEQLAAGIPPLKTCAQALAAERPEMHPSFFEFMSALAFRHFEREGVDIAIIETGLGGRLDATNVVSPEISVITSISLDHTDMLGDTLAQVAREKAGIIKPRTPVVTGLLPPEAMRVIREVAATMNAPVYPVSEYISDPDQYPETALEGAFQRVNAAIAKHVVKLLAEDFPVSIFHIQQGLDNVEWSGRWQRINLAENKHLILDATHNPEGAYHLDTNLSTLCEQEGRKPIILAGTTGSERARALMPVIARRAKEIHLLRPNQPRAVDFETLRAALPEHCPPVTTHKDLNALFPEPGKCILGVAGETLVATGSIYLIGEILERVLENQPAGGALLQD